MPDPITLGPDNISLDTDPALGVVKATIVWSSTPGNDGRLKFVSCNPNDSTVPRDEYEYPAGDFLPPNNPPPVVTDHQVTGVVLNYGTTYTCKVQSLSVDFTGDLDAAGIVAEGDLQIVTPALPQATDVCLVRPRSNPWLLKNNGVSKITVEVRKNGQPVPNIPVDFKIVHGKGQLSAAQAKSNGYGTAQVTFKATASKQWVAIKASSASAKNQTCVFVVVR